MNAPELMQEASRLVRAGRHAEAAAVLAVLAGLMPGEAPVWCSLGMMRVASGDLEGGEGALREATALDPSHADSLACLGMLLATRQRAGEAEGFLGRAAALAPGRADVLYAYTRLLTESGRAPEAVALLRAAIARHGAPGGAGGDRDPLLRSKLCMMLNYSGARPEEVFAAHIEYGRWLPPARALPAAVDRDPARPLRVGYLSPDLREHAVAYFLEPLLEHRSRGDFSVFLYHAGAGGDAVTARLRGLADGWREVQPLSDEETYQQIVADRIDVLIDLAGHTAGNRLPVMALRPAPVQATYIGYPNTTGVPAIGSRFVDATTDPEGSGADALATERLVRLPGCFLCYRPFEGAPDPGPSPCRRDGHLTFCSFNSLAKLSEATIAVWSRIVRELPGSRLMLKGKGLADPAVASRFASRFAVHGIGAERLELLSHTASTAEHMAAYQRADIALDPFPYGGTTTTCEALWMGVPVISLAGERHASRVGVSLLGAAGVPELVAATGDLYIATALELASNPERIAALRAGLRGRVRASPLCDAGAFVAAYEGALRALWREWCSSPR